MQDELSKVVEQVSASMGLDTNDRELSLNEKEALIAFVKDAIDINELISVFNLSDYEALIVTGIIGLKAVDNKENLDDIYYDIDNKLKPIVDKILNK